MKKDSKEVIERMNSYLNKGYILGCDDETFTGFNRTYFSTNEYIKEYLNLIDFNNKKNALTVMASGDQAFNLLNKGVLNIDTFDTNKLSEYYVLGIRRAMILKYNFNDYLNTISLLVNNKTSFDIINDILYGLLPFMEKKYSIFWKIIIDYNYNQQKGRKRQIRLLDMLFHNVYDVRNMNNYLCNEEEYNKLKCNLNKANLTFKCVNAIDLYKKFHKKYDLILLSNIMDYFYKDLGYEWNLDNYVNKLERITNKDSVIFLHYIFHYYSNTYIKNKHLIWGIRSNREELNNYIIEKLPYCNEESVLGSGMILKKNNNA